MNWLSALTSTTKCATGCARSITFRNRSTTLSRSAAPGAVIHCAFHCLSVVHCLFCPKARPSSTKIAGRVTTMNRLLPCLRILRCHLGHSVYSLHSHPPFFNFQHFIRILQPFPDYVQHLSPPLVSGRTALIFKPNIF